MIMPGNVRCCYITKSLGKIYRYSRARRVDICVLLVDKQKRYCVIEIAIRKRLWPRRGAVARQNMLRCRLPGCKVTLGC